MYTEATVDSQAPDPCRSMSESSQDQLSLSQSTRVTQMACRLVIKIKVYDCESLRVCGCIYVTVL